MDGRLRDLLERQKATGALMSLADFRSLRPPGTEFYAGPAETSATAFLVSRETEKNIPDIGILGELCGTIDWKPDDEKRARDTLSGMEPFLTQVRAVAELPPTRAEDIVKVCGLDAILFT